MSDRAREVCVTVFFLCVAVLSQLYVLTLLPHIPNDEYIVLLANKAVSDLQLPARELLLNYHYSTYLYDPLIQVLNAHVPIETYRAVLLFCYVFFTGYGAYIALRLMRLSRIPALVVAFIALMPRLSLGATFFGVFTNSENLARSIAFPFLWVLAGWFVRRLQDRKSVWPVLAGVGLASYLHPVSFIFFAGTLLLVGFFFYAWKKQWQYGLLQALYGALAFCLSATPLLIETFTHTKKIAGGVAVSGAEYTQALVVRLGWEFPPSSLIWLKTILIINLFFLLFLAFSAYLMKKRQELPEAHASVALRFSFLIAASSIGISILFPWLQLFMTTHFNAPLIIQQESRFFIYAYLGLFIAFGVCLEYFYTRIWEKKYVRYALLGLVVAAGLTSSLIGRAWVQFLIHWGTYDTGYIPAALQHVSYAGDFAVYPNVCAALHAAGASKDSLVVADDLRLRYFCDAGLYVTFQEGGAYLNTGREGLMVWLRKYNAQDEALHGSADAFLAFMRDIGAHYAVLDNRTDAGLVARLKAAGYPLVPAGTKALVVLP